jgi:hypothetical protein
MRSIDICLRRRAVRELGAIRPDQIGLHCIRLDGSRPAAFTVGALAAAWDCGARSVTARMSCRGGF